MKRYTALLSLLPFAVAIFLAGCNPVVTDIDVACSASALIDAINTANASPTTTTTLHLEPDCVYELTTSVTTDSGIFPAGVGLPEIISPIVVDGQAATIARSEDVSTPEFRIFLVGDAGDLTLNNIYLRGGNIHESRGYGGAVLNYGVLAINTCDVYNNTAHRGGAIYNEGEFNTLWTLYYRNHARMAGGAIQNNNKMTLDRSQFFENNAYWGGAVNNRGFGVFVEGSIFYNNEAITEEGVAGFGGAISNVSNPSGSPYGKMYVNSSRFNNNSAGHGGAIANMNYSQIAIHDSTFYENYAEYGGALLNQEEMTLNWSVLYSNLARYYGGAVYYQDTGGSFGTAIVNTTLSGNRVNGASPGTDAGSAIFHQDGGLGLRHVTITGNRDTAAYTKAGGNVTIENSIIALNPGGDCGGATIGTLGYFGYANIDSDGSCPTFTLTGDPLLDPLADNGGATLTHALQPGSPALDSGTGECSTDDQRHEPRPYGSSCDLGAFESQEFTAFILEELPIPDMVTTQIVPEWWWKFEGFVCSDSRLTEFYISTDADPELFNLMINERGVTCYQQSYDKTQYWCHVDRVMLDWESPAGINFCVGDLCENIERTTLSQARCEGANPPTEPEPQVCTDFSNQQDCSAAPGCLWYCTNFAAANQCTCVGEEP